MSKQLLLNFNQDGSLSQSQSTGSAIRQGDSNGEVTLVATFQNRRNDAYVAKLHFERPDGKKQRNIVMTPSASQSNQFEYSFLSGWFFAVAGTAKVTVTITDSNGAVSAQGSYSFAVEPTQVDVVDSTITYDEAAELEGLIADSIKRAKTVTLGRNVGVAGFYAACLSYLGDSTILDGDRFVGTTTIALNQTTQFFGEFVDDDKMLVIAKKRSRINLALPATIRHSVYVVSGDAQSPIVTEMVDSETLDSLFTGTAAKKAVSDQNGNVIDLTYATKAEVVAANNVGYIVINDTDGEESGDLTPAQAEQLKKNVCFIKYITSEGVEIYTPSHNFDESADSSRNFGCMIGWVNSIETGIASQFRAYSIYVYDLDTDYPSWEWYDMTKKVDEAPTSNSDNLVTSGGVHSAITTLESKISAVDDKVNYAIEAITKKDLYETQEATFQGMTAVPAGAMVKAYLDGFKGNSAVVNQLVQNGNFASSTGWTTDGGCTLAVANNKITVTVTSNGPWVAFRTDTKSISLVNGHKYLVVGTLTASESTSSTRIAFVGDGGTTQGAGAALSANAKTNLSNIFTASRSESAYLFVYVDGISGMSVGSTLVCENFMLIDLTAVPLTTAEMADVPTAKAALKHKDMDVDYYIPYNEGTLTDCRITKLISNPYNLFEEIMELGRLDLTTGGNVVATNTIRTKKPILVVSGQTLKFEIINNLGNTFLFMFDENGKVIPPSQWTTGINIGDVQNAKVITNTTYKSNTFVVPPNGKFVKFYCTDYGTTYRNDICIHLNSANLGYKPHIKPAARVILPPEYQQVEYIQSSGTQYIDTGLVGDAGYEIRAELNFTALSAGSYQYFGGFAYTGSANRVYYIRLDNSTNSLGYTYGSVNTDTTNIASLTADQWYDIDSLMNDKDQRLWLNGRLIGSSAYSLTGVDPTNPVNIYLFCSQYVSSATSYCQVKARRVRIFKDGNLVRDFVPCYKKANNEVGMFDLVSGSFFGNAGTGTFSKGDDCMETVYYLDMPALKSAGSVQDETEIGGKKVKQVDLGDLSYSAQTNYNDHCFGAILSGAKPVASGDAKANFLSKYPTIANSSQPTASSGISLYQTYMRISDPAFVGKTATEVKGLLTGTKINYEKAQSTDFSSTISYPEIIDVQEGGSVEVVGDGCDATTKVYFYVEA